MATGELFRGDTESISSEEINRLLEDSNKDVFARLIPANELAISALSWCDRRDIISARPGPVEVYEYEYLKQTDYASSFVERFSYEGSSRYCFAFSLKNIPNHMETGWRIGKGRTSQADLGVEFLLGIASDEHDVPHAHARFCWREGLSELGLAVDRPGPTTRIGVNRIQPIESEPGIYHAGFRPLPQDSVISIGELQFHLRFVELEEEEADRFQRQLRHVLSAINPQSSVVILPTPSTNDAFIGKWKIHYWIDSGGHGRVVFVTNRETGEPAAAKILAENKILESRAPNEVAMWRRLRTRHRPHIMCQIDIIQRRGRTNLEIDRVKQLLGEAWKPVYDSEYIIVLPHLMANLRHAVKSDTTLMPPEARTECFRQLLSAVEYLHAEGIWHRDIKPNNIGLDRYNPPHCQLYDFDCASTKPKILYDSPGTVIYLAPEQIEGQYHGCEVDLWACGIVGLELLGHNHTYRLQEYDGSLKHTLKWLQSQPPSPMQTVCKPLLVVNPELRINASDALDTLEVLLGRRPGLRGRVQKRQRIE